MTTPYGPPPVGNWQPVGGRLVVNTSYSWLWFTLRATGPKIEINGQPFKADWGPWMFDLPAGQYQLRVSTRYLGELGPAHISVFVYPRQQTTVYYRPPRQRSSWPARSASHRSPPGDWAWQSRRAL